MFGHIEHQNPSIIDAIGYCSRIRKNVTENREKRTGREKKTDKEKRTGREKRTEKPITESPIIAD